MRFLSTVPAIILASALGACTENTARKTLAGGAIGGGVGLVAGAIYGDPVESAARGALIGAAAGAVLGTVDDIDDGRGIWGGGY